MVRARSSNARLKWMQIKFPELDQDTIEALLDGDGIPSLQKDDDALANYVLPPLSPHVKGAAEGLSADGPTHGETENLPTPDSKQEEPLGIEPTVAATWVQSQSEPHTEVEPIDYQLGGRPAKRTRSKSSSTGRQEELEALQFEADQGRFPYPLDEERGRFSEGCDLVSFMSDGDLSRYLETRESSLVTRFIEVKGGEMRLTKNQVTAARRYHERYFVYHVALQKGGGQVIEMFRNPVDWSKPNDWVLEVNGKQAPESHREKFLSKKEQ